MNTNLKTRAWLEINLAHLCHNYRHMATLVSPAVVMAILKGNGYGLGARPLAEALLAEGLVQHIGVADPEEASELLSLGVPLQIIGSLLPAEIPAMVASGMVLPATDLTAARRISAEAVRQGQVARLQFKIDSGMGRLGIPLSEAVAVIKAAWNLPGVVFEGIYSHFPMATPTGAEMTCHQLTAFGQVINQLSQSGIKFKWCHIANSDAINSYPAACRAPFNMVRSGINLYGPLAVETPERAQLKPVVQFKTRLIARRQLAAGSTIGYDATCALTRPQLVGTIAAGYADGVPLALSNRGEVLLRGRRCPVLGRISMDYTTISLAEVPGAEVGDEVVCLGNSGGETIGVERWAELKQSHPYEVLCSFGKRVKRCYT